MGDWAEDKAREWLHTPSTTTDPAGEGQVASLAALLREVRGAEWKCAECGALTVQAADYYKRDVIAMVRLVVEEESRTSSYHLVDRILSALEKL